MDLKSKILKVVILVLLSVSRIYAFENLPAIYSLLHSDEVTLSENHEKERPVLSDLTKQEQSEEDAHFDASPSDEISFSFTVRYILTGSGLKEVCHDVFILKKLFLFFANLRI